MQRRIFPVVLCGGSGTRLWPMSRKALPKQFLPLVGEKSLLQDTVLRLAALPDCDAPIVVTGTEHRFLVGDQLAEIGIQPAATILEPVARNTALAVAALHVRRRDPDGVLLVLPSDHAIADAASFAQTVRAAVHSAGEGFLAAFGVRTATWRNLPASGPPYWPPPRWPLRARCRTSTS